MFMRCKMRVVFFVTLAVIQAYQLMADTNDYGQVTLMRDAQGVPHIFADNDSDAIYGLGYATAQDRLFQMTLNLRVIQGRLAETLGDIPLQGGSNTAATLDRKMRIFGYYKNAHKVYAEIDHQTRKLLQAYAAGVNAYIVELGDNLPKLFDDYHIELEMWSPADCIASWYQLARFFGGEGLHATLQYHQQQEIASGKLNDDDPRMLAHRSGLLVDDDAAVIQRSDVDDAWVAAIEQFLQEHKLMRIDENPRETTPSFSHAWVVGGEKSGTGSAVLFSDPQTPVRNPSLLYEFHVQGETFNTRGVGVAGSPVLLIGWNEHVAWGMTALAADQADQFFLRTDPDRPNAYEVDGEWQEMTVRTETIKIKGGIDEDFVICETRFGPVVTSLAHGVRTGEEVALKRVPQADDGHDTLQGAFAMMRSRSVVEFIEAIEGWRFPSANAVFGDRDGNIGYTLVGAFPVRSPHAEGGGRLTQYGWESNHDWQGILPASLAPRMTNPTRGYIFTANHRPIASFYPLDVLVGSVTPGDSLRSWRLRQLMEDQEHITPEMVKEIHYDTVNPARKAIVEIGLSLRDRNVALSADAMKALEVLELWHAAGARSAKDQPGYPVAASIDLMFRIVQTSLSLEYGGGQSGLVKFLRDISDKMDTDAYVPTDDVISYIDSNLAQAWRSGRNTITDARSQEAPQRGARGAQEASPGAKRLEYFATLYGLGSLNPTRDVPVPELTCTDVNTIRSQEGQAFSMWVPLHDVDSALSVLPVSNTENPDDDHYLAYLDAWSSGDMHPAPITRAAVEKIAVKSVVLNK